MKENIWYKCILRPTEKGTIASSAGGSKANFQRSQCLTRYSMRRGEVLQMHFALRVGGMAACSAGGSTATFKKYATIEALQKPVQSTNSS